MDHITPLSPDTPPLSEQSQVVRYLGIVHYGGRRMAAYETADGLAILRPISAMGLEAKQEFLIPLASVRAALR